MNVETEAQRKLDAAMFILRQMVDLPDGLDLVEAIRREGDKWWAVALLAEVESLRASNGRVRELHKPSRLSGVQCATCLEPMPCQTVRALDGEA